MVDADDGAAGFGPPSGAGETIFEGEDVGEYEEYHDELATLTIVVKDHAGGGGGPHGASRGGVIRSGTGDGEEPRPEGLGGMKHVGFGDRGDGDRGVDVNGGGTMRKYPESGEVMTNGGSDSWGRGEGGMGGGWLDREVAGIMRDHIQAKAMGSTSGGKRKVLGAGFRSRSTTPSMSMSPSQSIGDFMVLQRVYSSTPLPPISSSPASQGVGFSAGFGGGGKVGGGRVVHRFFAKN